MNVLIWMLVAIHPNDDMSFMSQHRSEVACRQASAAKALESQRYLKQPIAFFCIQATPVMGGQR